MLLAIIIVFVIAIIIIVIILYTSNALVPYKAPLDIEAIKTEYALPSPWSSSIDISDCKLFTFISDTQFFPANIKFTSIYGCESSDDNSCLKGRCGCMPSTQSCLDDDQVFAVKKSHTCLGLDGYGTVVPPSGTGNDCLQANGSWVPKGTIEEYYTLCGGTPSNNYQTTYDNRCGGSLAIMAFNLNYAASGVQIFENALCLEGPRYEITYNQITGSAVYTDLYPLEQTLCNMGAMYKSFPMQLFRIVKAVYNGGFTENSSGQYSKIVHRPSGMVLAGDSDPTSTKLILKTTKEGYYWYCMPLLKDNNNNGGYPQIIYVPNPEDFPKELTPTAVLNYIKQYNIKSIQPNVVEIQGKNYYQLLNNGIVNLKPYIYINFKTSSPLELSLAAISATSIIDYAIAPLIITDVSAYTTL